MTEREKQVLRRIRADVEASAAFDFLRDQTGWREDRLLTYFVLEAWGPATDGSARHQLRKCGEVERLARNIGKIAQRLRILNGDREWRGSAPAFVDLTPSDRARLREQFVELPDVLASYADSLRRKVEIVRDFAATEPPKKKSEMNSEQNLLDSIRAATGREYRDKVAAVMRVTHPLAGRKAPASALTINKRRQRSRRPPISTK